MAAITPAAQGVAAFMGIQQIAKPPALEQGGPAPGDDPAVKQAMMQAAEEQRRSRGLAANILTSGQGLLDTPNTAQRVLLGS